MPSHFTHSLTQLPVVPANRESQGDTDMKREKMAGSGSGSVRDVTVNLVSVSKPTWLRLHSTFVMYFVSMTRLLNLHTFSMCDFHLLKHQWSRILPVDPCFPPFLKHKFERPWVAVVILVPSFLVCYSVRFCLGPNDAARDYQKVAKKFIKKMAAEQMSMGAEGVPGKQTKMTEGCRGVDRMADYNKEILYILYIIINILYILL